jgi:hypothetical protein
MESTLVQQGCQDLQTRFWRVNLEGFSSLSVRTGRRLLAEAPVRREARRIARRALPNVVGRMVGRTCLEMGTWRPTRSGLERGAARIRKRQAYSAEAATTCALQPEWNRLGGGSCQSSLATCPRERRENEAVSTAPAPGRAQRGHDGIETAESRSDAGSSAFSDTDSGRWTLMRQASGSEESEAERPHHPRGGRRTREVADRRADAVTSLTDSASILACTSG